MKACNRVEAVDDVLIEIKLSDICEMGVWVKVCTLDRRSVLFLSAYADWCADARALVLLVRAATTYACNVRMHNAVGTPHSTMR